MAAIRFFSEFKSERSDEYTVQIWDKEYTGDPVEFLLGGEGFRISFSESGAGVLKNSMGTQCSFLFYMQTPEQETMIEDFAASAEGRFLVRILKGTDLYWCGVVLLDISSYVEEGYPYGFNIKAVDGIGSLEKVPFRDADDELYAGKAPLVEFLTRALSKIQHIGIFYDVGDVLLRTSVDWWEETMDVDPTGMDMLGQTYIDNAVYYKYEKTGINVMSCQEVIVDILKMIDGRITYFNGAFWVEQLQYRRAAIIVQREWDKEASFLGSENYNAQNTINYTAAEKLLAVGEYDWLAPVSEVRHFAAKQRRNLFAGAENVDETHTGIDTFRTPLNSNDGATTLRIVAALTLRISSNISVPAYAAPLAPFVVVLRINLFLKTVGLLRDYNLQPSYQFTYDMPVWDNPPAFYILQPIDGVFLGNVDDSIYTFAQQIDFITPPLTENTDQFTFSCQIEAIRKYTGEVMSLSDFEIQYDISNLWMEVFSNGGPLSNGEGLSFLTRNPNTNNTVVLESESLIGTSLNPNTLGALWVKPGADYQLDGNWTVGENDFTIPFIGQLMTSTIAGMREYPTKILRGDLIGNIRALARVLWHDLNWILIGGEWIAASNILSGRWLEIKDTEDLPPSDPIPFVAYPDPNPPSTSTDVPGGSGGFRVSAPLGTILYPVASTLSNEDIRAGSITDLNIQDTLSDYDFNAGDTLVIVNPFSGGFEELEVTALTLDGQTSIAVSGTLLNNYPVGSPIVRLPRIGAGYSLPGGPNGAIFKRVGGKWVAYSGATVGHVLTWNATTGATFQALPAFGTVTSVALSAPSSIFSVSGSPITSSGTLALALATQLANLVWAGPTSGGAAAPTFRALVAADIPNLDTAKITTGVFAIARGGTGLSALGSALQYLRVNAAGTALEYATLSVASGTVTSVALSLPGIFSVSGSPVTSSGTLAATLATQLANLVWAGPTSGSAAAPTFRALVALDIPNLDTSKLTTGTLPVARGGTGLAALGTALQYLRTNAAATAMEWATLAAITGSGTAGQVAFFSGAAAIDGDVSFLYNVSTFRLQINGTGSAVTPTAHYDLRIGTVSGNGIAMHLQGSVSNDWTATLYNTRSAAGGANAIWIAQVAATSSGDPMFQSIIIGGKTWSWGPDNSDLDKFKLKPQATLGAGATGGEGITITSDVTPLVGINTDTPAHPLDVNGFGRAMTYTNRTDPTGGTVTFGTGAGSGASLFAVVLPNGNMCTVRWTQGTSGTPGQRILNVIIPAALRHGNKIYVQMTAGNDITARDYSKIVVDLANTTPGNIAIKANSLLSALDNGGDYHIVLQISGHP